MPPRSDIQGIFCPHMVPIRSDGQINEPELRRLIDHLIEAGISGLYPNGSTGEFTRLSEDERRRVVRIAMEQTARAGRSVPVLAGASEANPQRTIDTLNHYADLGCRAGALIAPYYYPMSQASVRAYFEHIAERSRLDLVLYHIPQFANPIEVTTLVELCQHPRIVGVKDSARDLPRFLNTMAKIRPLRPDFACLIGCEEILVPALLMGADGGTVASSGVVPETLMAAYHAAKGGDWPTAVRIQYQMLELIETMLRGGDFPEGFRAGMVARGFDMGPGKIDLSPSQPARPELTQQIQCLIAEHGHTAPPAAGCPAPGHPAHGWPAHPNWQHANGVHEQFDPDLIRHLVEQVTQRLAGEHHPALTHANPTP